MFHSHFVLEKNRQQLLDADEVTWTRGCVPHCRVSNSCVSAVADGRIDGMRVQAHEMFKKVSKIKFKKMQRSKAALWLLIPAVKRPLFEARIFVIRGSFKLDTCITSIVALSVTE